MLTIYESRHLAPIGEVILPTKRQLSIPDSSEMAVTPDGHFVLVTNVTPATSVTLVDIQNRSVAGEIETSGCSSTKRGTSGATWRRPKPAGAVSRKWPLALTPPALMR